MEAVLTDEQVEEIWTAIDEQTERRDEHDRSESPMPPSPLALYMRALATFAAFTAGLLLAGQLLESPSWARLAGSVGVMLIGALGLRHRTTRVTAGGLLAGVTATLLLALVVLAIASTGVS